MRILFFGDIVGEVGRKAVLNNISKLITKYQIDFVIANGENATHGKGLIERHYLELIDGGVDCLTLGNHYLSKNQILDYIDDATNLVRPINLSKRIGGEGSLLFTLRGVKIRVTNVLGEAFMNETVTSPYYTFKNLLDSLYDEDSIHIVDFHGEATSEKIAFAYAFDGSVSAIVGTHTHVQTNDARILDNGTGFISDAGMCGDANGILGFEKNSVMNKTLFGNKSTFEIDVNGQQMVNAVVIDIDEYSKKCRDIFPIRVLGERKHV